MLALYADTFGCLLCLLLCRHNLTTICTSKIVACHTYRVHCVWMDLHQDITSALVRLYDIAMPTALDLAMTIQQEPVHPTSG